MSAPYRVVPGHVFVDSDGTLKAGGELLELDADMAELHAGKVEALEPGPLDTPDTPAE